jgi:hypothetical protein
LGDRSAHDPRVAGRRREFGVLVAVLGVLVATVCNLIGAARHGKAVDEGRLAVDTECQRILDEIRTSMIGAIPVARVEADGALRWLDHLAWQPTARPIEFTRLARASAGVAFGKESRTASRTGNAVLFARPSRHAWIRGSDRRAHRICTYRLVCYYLTDDGGGSRLDLARFVSVRVADVAQLEAVTTASDRAEILRVLAADTDGSAVRWLWRPGETPAAGILRIDSATGAMRAGMRLPADAEHSVARVLSSDRFSVATNATDATDDTDGVGRLAFRSSAHGGFPHGFELQFGGPASARQMELHLTLIGGGSICRAGDVPVSADLRSIAVVGGR